MIGAFIEQVDQYKMESAQREIGEGAFADVGCLWEVKGTDMMRDVRNMTFRAVLPELPFDGPYQVVLHSYV